MMGGLALISELPIRLAQCCINTFVSSIQLFLALGTSTSPGLYYNAPDKVKITINSSSFTSQSFLWPRIGMLNVHWHGIILLPQLQQNFPQLEWP